MKDELRLDERRSHPRGGPSTLRRAAGLAFACILLGGAIAALAGVAHLGFAPDALQLKWPNDVAGRAETAAVACAVLIGVVVMLRVGLARLQPLRSKPTEREIERLRSEARTDTLTALGNRRAFNEDLALEVERRNSTGSFFSLMAIDLDGLKEINDVQGHQAGDAHLQSVAARVAAEVGPGGTVYRTGGDEFMVLLPGARNFHAMELAHRIQGATSSSSGQRAVSIGVTESISVEHRQELIRQADLALYEAKRQKLPVVPYRAAPQVGPAGIGGPKASSMDTLGPPRETLAKALARALRARDQRTGEHAELVAEFAAAIGSRQGFGGLRLERLRTAALLHDLGKIAIDDSILRKRGRLTADEQTMLRQHVPIGRDLLEAVGLHEEAMWVLHHHEHFDGTGYPGALRGDAIPLESRIIAVADAYEAMTSTRHYGERLTAEAALAELAKQAGSQFDPACVQSLVAVVRAMRPDAARRTRATA